MGGKKNFLKKERNSQELWDNYKKYILYVRRIGQEEERKEQKKYVK